MQAIFSFFIPTFLRSYLRGVDHCRIMTKITFLLCASTKHQMFWELNLSGKEIYITEIILIVENRNEWIEIVEGIRCSSVMRMA